MKSINPATGQVLREYSQHTDAAICNIVRKAAETFVNWRETAVAERAGILHSTADLLRSEIGMLASLITDEMGKPVTQAEAEVEKCAWVCEYYAENAGNFLRPKPFTTESHRNYVRFDPLGPVLAVMPWNFPFWQVFRFAAPALMAGNVVLLKHASNVQGCAEAIEGVLKQAGLPDGVMQNLRVGSDQVGRLIEDPIVRAVTLTGSETAGQAVAGKAGQHIKKTVLELGGSDPFIVLADADLAAAADNAVKARTMNSGQSCIAAKRFIVESAVLDSFIDQFVAQLKTMVTGDPANPATDIGPLARKDLREDLHQQVTRSVHEGATVVYEANIPESPGYFYPPTVLTNVRPGMPAFDEETFGPVAAVIEARDPEDALRLANESRFGLGASLWTGDMVNAERIARQLDVGCVAINEIVKSDPRLPFGGIKRSGYGRELSDIGIREFTNIKTVSIHGLNAVQEASDESFPASDAPA